MYLFPRHYFRGKLVGWRSSYGCRPLLYLPPFRSSFFLPNPRVQSTAVQPLTVFFPLLFFFFPRYNCFSFPLLFIPFCCCCLSCVVPKSNKSMRSRTGLWTSIVTWMLEANFGATVIVQQ